MNKTLIIGGNGYVGTRLYSYLSVDEENMQSDKDVDIIDTCWFVGLDKPIEDTLIDEFSKEESIY